ncbi:MAG TPA: hypothetical protein PK264_22735, partial [Hyphomicrobiaceae bacterium]|nr:hypothetical protein [Hyphomicrobiaceae bacterium]
MALAHRDGTAVAKAASEALLVPKDRILHRRDQTAGELRALFAPDGEVAAALRGRTQARMLLYVSGRGVREAGKPYILAGDVDVKSADDIRRRGYSLETLLDDLTRVLPEATEALVLLEASFEDHGATGADAGTTRRAPSEVTLVLPSARPRIAVMLAAAADESAASDMTAGRELGLFTDTVIDGLYGLAAPGRPQVTIAELERFVTRRMSERLPALFPGSSRTQRPVVISDNRAMVIARFDGPAPVRDAAGSALETRECQLLSSESDL